MREITNVNPAPSTEKAILRHGLSELAMLATGSHADPNQALYRERREIKAYAQRILAAAGEAAKSKHPRAAEPDDQKGLPMLTSSQTILELRDEVNCTFETDREEGGRGHVFAMDRDTWEDMGRPSSLSLLIEPGDSLND